MDHLTTPTDDAVPVDFATLVPGVQVQIMQQITELERQELRAAALHERLAAYGLGAQADVLGLRNLISNLGRDAERLDAIEEIVAVLEAGPATLLFDRLKRGTGTAAALRLLDRVHHPKGAAAFGERLAVSILCEADAGALNEGHPDAAGWADALDDTEQALRNRLEIVQTARNRLRYAKTEKP